MRAREVVLALLIIGAGVFLTYEKSGRFDRMFEGWDLRIGLYDEFLYEETTPIDGPFPSDLKVVNSHGQIDVAGSAEETPTVVFRKRVMARNKAEADRIAAQVKMTVDRAGSSLILGTNRESFRRPYFETDFKIAVPAKTACTLDNSYGRVRAEGLGTTGIANPHGEIVVRGISGPLAVSSSYEDLDIDGVRGPVRVEAPHSDMEIKNVDGTLEIDHSNGTVSLDRIGGRTVVRTEHAGITARSLGAEAVIETTYDAVKVIDAGDVKIRGRHCDITAENLSGILDITDDYGLVRINGLRGNLKIDGCNVEVNARDIASPDIFVKTGYQDVLLTGFSGKAVVILNNGSLALEPVASLSGAVEVQGSYADVRIAWPAGFRAPLLVQARDGQVTWTLPEKPDSETTNGVTELRAFSDETGKAGLKVVTVHGDVRVDPAGR